MFSKLKPLLQRSHFYSLAGRHLMHYDNSIEKAFGNWFAALFSDMFVLFECA
jgi:hypothetical protein